MSGRTSFGRIRFCYSLEKKIALLLSVIFHPVMLPTLFFTFAAAFTPEILTPFSNSDLQLRFIVLIFITTAVIPVIMLSIHFLLSKRKVSLAMLYLHNTKDRIYPFIHTGLFYAGIAYLFDYSLHFNVFICSFMGMVAIAVLAAAAISVFYKVSAHLLALTAVAGYLFRLHFYLSDTDLVPSLCILIFIAGLTASSRLFLNAHTPLQLFAGCIVGLLSAASTLFWFY